MLGFILAPLGQKVPGQYPNEIQYSYGGTGTFLCPFDPQYETHGERGLYFDTQLGDIPTDAELSTSYGYTPVAAGAVAAKEGFFTPSWIPPGGWDSAGPFAPPVAPPLSGAAVGAGAGVIVLYGLAAFGAYVLGKRLLVGFKQGAHAFRHGAGA